MKLKLTTMLLSFSLLVTSGCREFYDYFDEVEPKVFKATEYISDLAAPHGLALDSKDQLWVTEIGTGKNDGKVSVITTNGVKHVVIEGFPSFMGPGGPEEIIGLNHLLEKDGMLYILHANGIMFKADVSTYKHGDAPQQASNLMTENIAAFVLDYDFAEDTEESNPYNLTVGPGGNIYITDAAANAVIRRSASGQLSVFATFPDFTNPTPVGPPTIDAVPTGIAYTGQNFYVTSLTGFPFISGAARIYRVSNSGKVSIFSEGYTTMTDVALDPINRPTVVEHAQFGPQGFVPNSGRIAITSEDGQATLVEGLNRPTSIVRSGLATIYVNSLPDNKIYRVQIN